VGAQGKKDGLRDSLAIKWEKAEAALPGRNLEEHRRHPANWMGKSKKQLVMTRRGEGAGKY